MSEFTILFIMKLDVLSYSLVVLGIALIILRAGVVLFNSLSGFIDGGKKKKNRPNNKLFMIGLALCGVAAILPTTNQAVKSIVLSKLLTDKNIEAVQKIPASLFTAIGYSLDSLNEKVKPASRYNSIETNYKSSQKTQVPSAMKANNVKDAKTGIARLIDNVSPQATNIIGQITEINGLYEKAKDVANVAKKVVGE